MRDENKYGYDAHLSAAARAAINREMKRFMIERIFEWCVACTFGVLLAWAAVDGLAK